MAQVNGLETVNCTSAVPEAAPTAGLMIFDRLTSATPGLMRINSTLSANEATARATGLMLANYTNASGHMKVESNS